MLKTLRDPEVLRFFLLSSHYRGPINYSEAQLTQADETLLGLYRALADRGGSTAPGAGAQSQSAGEMRPVAEMHSVTEMRGRFDAAMDDDFNTPDALAVMQGAARDLNTAKAAGRNEDAAALADALRDMGGVLGLLQQPPSEYLKRGVGEAQLSDAQVDALIEARRAARAMKNFAESDRIRDVLASAGIALEDKPHGATGWRRA